MSQFDQQISHFWIICVSPDSAVTILINADYPSVRSATEQVDEALDSADELSLLAALQLPCLALKGVRMDHGPWYLDQLSADRRQKAEVDTRTDRRDA